MGLSYGNILWYIVLIFGMWIGLRYLFVFFSMVIRKFTEPYLEKIDIHLNEVKYPISYSTIKGGRPYQVRTTGRSGEFIYLDRKTDSMRSKEEGQVIVPSMVSLMVMVGLTLPNTAKISS
jgi:hypothetical protein